MSTVYRYTLPVEQTEWKFEGNTETCFTWEYDAPREALLQLYAKGKKQQWDAAERIDWSLDLDPETRCCSTTGSSTFSAPICGSG